MIITKEMMLAAKDYMPLRDKSEISKQIAQNCLASVGVSEDNKIGNKFLAVPPMKEEVPGVREILLMQTLLAFYFGLEVEIGKSEDPFIDYDNYAKDHILNQIERFKHDAELRDKSFDLISDYRELCRMVENCIRSAKENENDAIARVAAGAAVLCTPEVVGKILETIKAMGEKAE